METFCPGAAHPLNRDDERGDGFSDYKKMEGKRNGSGFSVSGVDSGTFYITSLMRTATEGDEDIGISLTLVERRRLSEKRSTGKEGVTGERNKAGNSIKKIHGEEGGLPLENCKKILWERKLVEEDLCRKQKQDQRSGPDLSGTGACDSRGEKKRGVSG